MSKRSAQVLDERTMPGDADEQYQHGDDNNNATVGVIVVETAPEPEPEKKAKRESRTVAIDKRLQEHMQAAVNDAMTIGSRRPILLELTQEGDGAYVLAYTPRSSDAGLWLLRTLEHTRLNFGERHTAICAALVEASEPTVRDAFSSLRNNTITGLDALGDFCWVSAGGEQMGLQWDVPGRATTDLYDMAHALYRQRGSFW